MDDRPVILVVDDDAMVREALGQSIEVRGNYKVLRAASGEEAIPIAREQHPDLILLDVQMQGIDGFETARRLQQDDSTKSIPLLFLTGEAKDINFMKEAFDIGAEDYLTKGLSTKEILLRIEHTIKRHKRASEG